MVLIALKSEHLLYFMKFIKLESQVPGTDDFLLHDGALRLYHFEQAGCALTAANAHGDHHIFGTPALAFNQGMAGKAGTAHTIGVTHRNRAAIHVQFFHRNTQTVAAVDHLGCKGFVQLPQVNVVHGQAVTGKQAWNSKHRPMPISSGSQPATAKPRKMPMGSMLCFSA